MKLLISGKNTVKGLAEWLFDVLYERIKSEFGNDENLVYLRLKDVDNNVLIVGGNKYEENSESNKE